MSVVFRNTKLILVIIISITVFIISILGGALGNQFGGGFLGAPLAHIQISAETVNKIKVTDGYKYALTNTVIATWLSIFVLLLLSLFVKKSISDVPGRLQSIAEIIVEFFLNLAESMTSPEKARKFLPLVLTIFLFVLTSNWLGILPGFGTIGKIESREDAIHHAQELAEIQGKKFHESDVHTIIFDGEGSFGLLPIGSIRNVKDHDDHSSDHKSDEHKHKSVEKGKQEGLLIPYFRSANTDLNTTLAIAIVAMVLVHFWGFSILGFGSHLSKFINFKSGPVGFFVGILEGISEFARIISFTFRLFGNIFAGEVLLFAMAFLLPLIGIIPFLGLELFVGLIQALIFSVLTLVFASMATVSHGDEDH